MKYDLIVSLGGNCAAACQLRMRGLRRFSLPFDWLYMDSIDTVKWLAQGIRSDFHDFFRRENLRPMAEGQIKAGTARYRYKDEKSGFNFIHHFHKASVEDGGYDEVGLKMRRRMDRLLRKVSESQAVLFILATNFEYDLDLAEDLVSSFRERFPDVRIDFRIIQFGAGADSSGIIGKPGSNTFCIWNRYVREIGHYDLSLTSHEWSFLDCMAIRGYPLEKLSGFDKVGYKIWKKMSRYFLEKGLALKDMSFRNSRKAADSGHE